MPGYSTRPSTNAEANLGPGGTSVGSGTSVHVSSADDHLCRVASMPDSFVDGLRTDIQYTSPSTTADDPTYDDASGRSAIVRHVFVAGSYAAAS